MPWITTKSGKRINTDWFDDDEKRKQQQIESNKQEADKKNEVSKPKQALEYVKSKIDKESASFQELYEDAKYEYGLSGREAQQLKDSMMLYALKNGKFEKHHKEWKEDWKLLRGFDYDKEMANRRILVEKNDPKSLISKDSYVNDKDYKEASDSLRRSMKESQELSSKSVELYKQYDAERDKHLDPEMVSLLGKSQARMFVKDSEFPELAELKDQLDDVSKRQKTLQLDIDKNQDFITQRDKTMSKAQRINYGEPRFEEASGKYPGFKTDETRTPYIDELIKDGKATIVEMTPEQYMHECAHYIFTDSTFEKVLRGRTDDVETSKYAKMMRDGTKFDTPYLNYKDEQQEGLHRAVAAYINGIEKIPVVIVGKRRKS